MIIQRRRGKGNGMTRSQIMSETIKYQAKHNALYVDMLAILHKFIESNVDPALSEQLFASPECQRIYQEAGEIENNAVIEIFNDGSEGFIIKD
jgi:hypothetical protein